MNDQKYHEAVEKINEAAGEAAKNIGEALAAFAKSIEPTVQKMREATQKIYEIQKASTEPDLSRRRFEAVATKGKRRNGWKHGRR